jgi:hypothetical protein
MPPKNIISAIVTLHATGRASAAMDLAYRTGKQTRLVAPPQEIQGIPDLVDAWEYGQASGDEEHAFMLGFQRPNDEAPPESVRSERQLVNEFRNGQMVRRNFRGIRIDMLQTAE